MYYLETAVSVAQPFLHGANTPDYKSYALSYSENCNINIIKILEVCKKIVFNH
jgi:hypothetical protein